METIRLEQTINKNGEIHFKNLPLLEGQKVEVIISFSSSSQPKKNLTARELLNSDLIGLWENRSDITDSLEYANQLREKAQRRDYDIFR